VHDAYRFRLLGGVEAGCDECAYQPRGKYGCQHGENAYNQHHQVGDGAGQSPRPGQTLVGQDVGEDGDEGCCQGAPGHHGKQQIGQLEGSVVGIQVGPNAKLAGDDDVAHQTHERGQAKGPAYQQAIADDVAPTS
jgi:hypothetical protein